MWTILNPIVIQTIAISVRELTEVRLRWSGHRLHAEVNLAVSPKLSVAEAHSIAVEVRHQLLHHLPYLSNVTIHIDPENLSGEEHHRIIEHTHEGLPIHSHR
jgi:divalent metal cation (Fe/Co/Zn/Cd) transporter